MKILLFIVTFIIAFSLQAGVIYYGGGEGVLLEDRLKFSKDGKTIAAGDVDPTSVAITGATGSLYLGDSSLYWKQDSGSSTNWFNVLTGLSDLEDLGDVTISATAQGDTLYYDAATSLWKNGKYSQIVIVDQNAASGALGQFSTIQGAIDSITDNSESKKYIVYVQPGTYAETIVMEDWVSIVGQQCKSEVKITGATGPLLTFPNDTNSKQSVSGLSLILTPTTNAQDVVSIPAGTSISNTLKNVTLTASSSTADITATLIDQDGTTLNIAYSRLNYTFSGTHANAKTHNILDMAGISKYALRSNVIDVTVADVNDTVIAINEASAATIESHFEYNRIHVNLTNVAYSGAAGLFYAHGAGQDKNALANHAHLESAGNGTGYAFFMDTTGNNGEMHATGNRVIVEGFALNYLANIGTGDTFYSHFDDISAVNGITGAGSFESVSSFIDGDLTATGTVTAVNFIGDGSGLTDLSSAEIPWETPGTIGSTTPSTGAFTTLETSGDLSVSGTASITTRVLTPQVGITADTNLMDLTANLLTVNGDLTSTGTITAVNFTGPIGAMTPSTGAFSTATLTGDLQVNGNNIGISTDTDLLLMADNLLTVNGDITSTGTITAVTFVGDGGGISHNTLSGINGSADYYHLGLTDFTNIEANDQLAELDTGGNATLNTLTLTASLVTPVIGLAEDLDLIALDNGVVTIAGDLAVDGNNIGITADSDLVTMAADKLTISGTVLATDDLHANDDLLVDDDAIITDDLLVSGDTTLSGSVSFTGNLVTNTATDYQFLMRDPSTGEIKVEDTNWTKLREVQSITYNLTTLDDYTTDAQYTPASLISTGAAIIDPVDSGANSRTEFTALKDCELFIAATHYLTDDNAKTVIRLNGTDIIWGVRNEVANSWSPVSANLKLNEGDVVLIGVGATGSFRNAGGHWLTMIATADSDAVIHGGKASENTFAARISNGGSAAIVTQSGTNGSGENAIASVSRTAAGKVTVTPTTDFFTVNPVIELSFESTTGNSGEINITSVSTSSITIETFNFAGDLTDLDFHITLNRQSTDYIDPTRSVITQLTETCHIYESQTSGTNGGTFTQTTDVTRTLNSTDGDCSWLTLDTNQMTLAPGKYTGWALSPCFDCGHHRNEWYDVDNTTTIKYGSEGSAGTGGVLSAFSFVFFDLDISEPTTYTLRDRCSTTQVLNGLGVALALGDEVYSQIWITKLTTR